MLRPNPRNPRRNFSEAELDDLAASIKERGIIQPVVVRPIAGAKDAYEIIAGERRWRAAQRAGLHEIPIVLFEVSDSEALELAIIENVQRTDLNPLEEAGGYQALASEYDHSHDDIAKIVGKSRSHVTNTLRLLKLPEPVKAYIHAGKITAGAARMLIGAPDPEEMAREIVERGLNVRQVEALAKDRARERASRCSKRGARRAPIRLRSNGACPMRSAWRSRSITAATAACCRSTIAVSINSTMCCDGWTRTDPTVPTTSALAAARNTLRCCAPDKKTNRTSQGEDGDGQAGQTSGHRARSQTARRS